MKKTQSNNRLYGSCLAGIALMLMLAGNARADYQSTVLSDSPLAYYPLDLSVDTAGVATDLSGNGLNGTYQSMDFGNSVSGPSAYIANAASFDGSWSYVDLGAPDLLNFEGQITLEAWAQPTETTTWLGDIIGKGYDADYNEIPLRQNPNGNFDGPGGVSGPSRMGGWSYVVSTYDGTNWNLYINGALVQSKPSSTGSIKFASPWAIGNGTDSGDGRMFVGNICQVAFYNVGLTPDQIQMHYYMGKYGGTNFAPGILSQPAADTIYPGGTARFSVGAESTSPVTYQWFKGASSLSGQTNASLVLTNMQAGDAGNYGVKISNVTGTTTSDPAILTVLTPGVYGAGVMADKPLAFYPLNESSGTMVVDYANSFNGTYENSPTLGAAGPTPYISSGVQFSGANGQIADLGNRAEMNISGLVSMEAWVQAGVNGNGYIVAHGLNMDPTIETELKAQTAGFDIEEYGVNYKGAIAPYQAGDQSGNWVYLAGTWDGTNWNIYRNGVLAASTPAAGGIVPVNDCPWAIGGSGTTGWGGRNFVGAISQVAIYDHPLTAAQVMAHYHLGTVGTTNPPPTITSDLTARSVYAGGTLHLTASFDSAMPLSYAWYKGATVLAGQTNATLVLSNIQAGDAGSYKVIGTSQAGSATSAAATLTVLTPGLYGAVVMSDEPFAYYPLDETSGSTAVDYAGAFDGAYQNSPGLGAAGPSTYINSGVKFTRDVHQYVDLGNYTEQMNISGPITMEAWVLPNNVGVSTAENIIAKGWMQNPVYSEIVLRANGSDYSGGDVNGSVGGASETADWTHLVSTYDGTNWTLYKNGTLIGTTLDTNGIAPFSAPWAIANGSLLGADRYFDGTISQVAIYNHSLTASQVAAHYQMGTSGTYLPPAISSDLASRSAYAGTTVRLSVKASSAVPMGYLWYKGATLLTDQTNATVVFANLQASDAGSYSVKVTNQVGSVTSASAILTVAVPSSYESSVIGDSPLLFCPLNESSGVTAIDYASGFNGTYSNAPAMGVAGPSSSIGSAVGFDGASQSVNLGNHPELNFSGKITMEAWVKPSSADTFGDILAKGWADDGSEVMLRANGTYGGYFGGGNGNVNGGTETADWTYLACSNDGTNWNMYMNGVLVQSSASTGGAINFSAPWSIASGSLSGVGRYFAGAISHVALYNYALTPSQVVTHYQMGSYGAIQPPTISSDPVSCQAYVGGTFRLTVGVSSGLPLTYEWYKGASLLPNQTNATLVLSNAQAGDAGQYHAVATAQTGSATSGSATLTVLPVGAYGAAVMANNPIAYYPLNETSGTNAFDYAGQGFNGVYMNSPTLGVAGPTPYVSSCVSFHGSYVDLGHFAGMNVIGAITMEAWVQPESSDVGVDNNYDILARGYSWTPQDEQGLRGKANEYQVMCWSKNISLGGAPKTASWTHLVGTCDGTNWYLYANGVLVGQTPGTGVTSYSAPWTIANGSLDGNGRYFNGNICQVALYDHALTADQIQAHYVAGQSGGVATTPVISSVKVADGNLTLTGTGGTPNASFSIVTATDLATPLNSWTVAGTATFDSAGAFNITSAINPAATQQFYKLKQ